MHIIAISNVNMNIIIGWRYASIGYAPFLSFEENALEDFGTICVLEIDT